MKNPLLKSGQFRWISRNWIQSNQKRWFSKQGILVYLIIKSILHLFIPRDHPSPHCNVCSTSTVEDHSHFFFSCPPKLQVWREMYRSFISTTPVTDTNLIQHLHDLLHCKSISLDRDSSLPSLISLSINSLHVHFWLYGKPIGVGSSTPHLFAWYQLDIAWLVFWHNWRPSYALIRKY